MTTPPTAPEAPDHGTEARALIMDPTCSAWSGPPNGEQAVAVAQVHALLALDQTIQSLAQALAEGFLVLDARLKSISAELRDMEVDVDKIEDHLDEIQRKFREG